MIEQTWQTRFYDFAEALALPIGHAISEHDIILLDAYAYDLIARPSLYIHTIHIQDLSGHTLVALPEEASRVSGKPTLGDTITPNRIRVSTPLAWNGEAVGELQVIFTDTPVKQALARMQSILIGIAFLCAFISILISVRIAARLLQPLSVLVAQINTLRHNQPVELTPLVPSDEIAEMGNSFLAVYADLQEREHNNREMVSQLEQLTQQLTDELTLNAQLRERLEEENEVLHARVEQRHGSMTVIGQDGDLAPVLERAHRAAQSRLTVLLSGESGTGKEVLANYIHQASDRHKQSFIPVNCAAYQNS